MKPVRVPELIERLRLSTRMIPMSMEERDAIATQAADLLEYLEAARPFLRSAGAPHSALELEPCLNCGSRLYVDVLVPGTGEHAEWVGCDLCNPEAVA